MKSDRKQLKSMKERRFCHEKENNFSSTNNFKLFLLILFMELSDILDLKKVMSKASPSIPIFIFGYILILNQSISNWIFLIISILFASIFFALEEDKLIVGMSLLFLEHQDKEKIASEIGKSKLKPFVIKSLILFATFIWRIFALIVVIIYTINKPDLVLLILLILNAVGILYSIIIVIIKNNISRTVKLIKSNNRKA